MKQATLAIIKQDNKVVLGEKKVGEIGMGTLNGPGGKLDAGETLEECVIRETFEELGIKLDYARLELVALVTFFAGGVADFEVYVYLTDTFSGELHETGDMVPDWYPVDDLPYERMLESDHEWFARAARGEKFRAHVYYKERAKDFERIEFYPFP